VLGRRRRARLGRWKAPPIASTASRLAGRRPAAGAGRVLTQETHNGKPAQELARTKPNPMINGHQDWLDGLVAAACQKAAKRRLTTEASP
jgi:hypothetical protein